MMFEMKLNPDDDEAKSFPISDSPYQQTPPAPSFAVGNYRVGAAEIPQMPFHQQPPSSTLNVA